MFGFRSKFVIPVRGGHCNYSSLAPKKPSYATGLSNQQRRKK